MKIHTNTNSRRGIQMILFFSVLLVLFLPMVIIPPTSAQSSDTLRKWAETISRGSNGEHLLIGFAAADNFSSQDQQTAKKEFNFLTAENIMKMSYLQPSQGSFSWGNADTLVNFAKNKDNDMEIHGHVLVWHNSYQIPNWVKNKSWTRDSLLNDVMYKHIDAVMGRYKGKILVWDVVNEAFQDNGTYRNNDLDSNNPGSLWYRTIGQDYIELAFKRARQADPNAKLIYNDYNVATNDTKFNAIYTMVEDFKKRGVPIDGVGFQMHIAGEKTKTADRVFDDTVLQIFIQKMQKLANLGLEVYITEMDVRFNTNNNTLSASQLQVQKDIYGKVMKACVEQPACKGFQVWGITDGQSWVPSTFSGEGGALLFDNSYKPKPAYDGILEALKNTPQTPHVFVNQNAKGSNDGSSWQNAYTDLQVALANVSSGQIWVAKGVYYPGKAQLEPNNREATFQLKNGVAIYGGFAGNENSLGQRNVATNITVLSGDMDQNDVTDANKVVNTPDNIKGYNAYHVVSGNGVTRTAILDGFTITGGNANGVDSNGHPVESQQQGGGMRNDNGSPTLANVTFSGNRATWGGGMANYNGSLPKITNATFNGNQAIDGGGVYNNDSGPVIENAVFSGNKVTGDGGAMMSYECGGDYINNNYVNYPTVRNSTFAGNYTWDYSHYSGAIHNYRSIASYSNCIMWGNSQPERSIYNVESMVGVGSSDFEGCQGHNDGGVPFDCGIYDSAHKNKKVDPMFVNPISASSAPTTAGDYRLKSGSPVINMGNIFSVTVRLDRDNKKRIVDDTVDMGAYEYSSEANIYLPLILQPQ